MPSRRAASWKLMCTLSASQIVSGLTSAQALRASYQNATGTSEATSQRKPSTMPAHIFSVSIW